MPQIILGIKYRATVIGAWPWIVRRKRIAKNIHPPTYAPYPRK